MIESLPSVPQFDQFMIRYVEFGFQKLFKISKSNMGGGVMFDIIPGLENQPSDNL